MAGWLIVGRLALLGLLLLMGGMCVVSARADERARKMLEREDE